jgi:5-methyltetrahydrofolate--homocysteine methyltransferase
MKNTYILDWQKVYDRFEGWWNREEVNRPLMYIVAKGKRGNPVPLEKPPEPSVLYLDPKYMAASYRNFCETHFFLADAFPNIDVNLGPGSMTLYLGGEPEFAWDTLWYHEFMDSPKEFEKLRFDANNKWWVKHQEIAREALALADNDFYVTIPDIIENLDILSALRGPQNFCFDMIDEGEAVHKGVEIIDDLYFTYYDTLYNMVKSPEDIVSYTAFKILGKGKVAKVQCDFCAMISPAMFREFVQPSLRKQCQKLNHSLYHLDGPDAIKHVDALMEIKELDALQWTCGAGKPDGACERWYPIYDKVRDAGKGLWIQLYDGGPEDWAEGAKRLVKRYGKKGMYFLPPVFPDRATAEQFATMFD